MYLVNWQQQLKNTTSNIADLCNELSLDINALKLNIDPKFPLRVPKYYLTKIDKNNPTDPLLLQILPDIKELINKPSFCSDPLNENKYNKIPGLIHKYHNRVLLTITSACGIHCRYCFRQNFPYSDNIIAQSKRQQQIDYISNNKNINEIILSGGDPLCASNKYIENIVTDFSKIEHITTIRFHTRMPIVIPDRINNSFIDILNKFENIKFIIVTHCNHPNELDTYIAQKIKLLINNNITVLNQSVLLQNINNNSDTLIKLSNKLFECNILPYYLHMLDPVTGTSHFDVNINTAKQLMTEISKKLPGYLVPKLVREIPGEPNKTVVI